MNKREINKQLNQYIFPSMLAMIGISCYVLADTFFISVAAGANGITALNLSLPIYAVMFALGSMIGMGSATKYSLEKALGKKEYEVYYSNSVLWSLGISGILLLMGLTIPQTILRLMGADETILAVGVPYLRIALLFAPAFLLNYTMTAFVRNDNDPKLAMAATLSSSMFNIVFDYIFMFPMKMGIVGAALATGLAPIVSISVCMVHYFSKKNTLRFVKKLPSIRKLIQACSLGMAAFVGEISGGVTTLCFNFVLLKLVGNIGVAAYGVIANISIVGIALFNGIAQGLQPMASEAGGKGQDQSKRQIYRHSRMLGLLVAGVAIMVCLGWSSPIVALFNTEQSVQMAELAQTGLRLYSIGFLMAGINIIRAGYLGAIGHAFSCTVISLLRGVVAIVLFVILLPRFMGVYGVWLAFPVAETFTLLVGWKLPDR